MPGVLWKHFEHVQGSSGVAVGKCKMCFKTFSIKNLNTSGMLKHLKLTHPQIFKEVQESKASLKRSAALAGLDIDDEHQLGKSSGVHGVHESL